MSIHFDFSKLLEPLGLPVSLDDFRAEDFPLTQVILSASSRRASGCNGRGLPCAPNQRQRRCTASKPDGQPCKAWAVWHADEQKCIKHLSAEACATYEAANQDKPCKTPRPTCGCTAYPFPHRQWVLHRATAAVDGASVGSGTAARWTQAAAGGEPHSQEVRSRFRRATLNVTRWAAYRPACYDRILLSESGKRN